MHAISYFYELFSLNLIPIILFIYLIPFLDFLPIKFPPITKNTV